MSSTIKLTGNLLVQLAEGAQPSPVPVGFEMTYTEKVIYGFNYNTPVANQPVPAGSVTNPRFVLVFLYEGSISLAWNIAGGFAGLISFVSPLQRWPLTALFLARQAERTGLSGT